MRTTQASNRNQLLIRVGAVVSLIIVFWISGRWVLAAMNRGPIAFVADVAGDVTLVRTDGALVNPVAQGMLIFPGDQIRTGLQSWAEIEHYEDVALRVEELSHLTINQPPLHVVDDEGKASVSLTLGEVWVHVTRKLARILHFSVETPSAVAGVRGTVFRVVVGDDGGTEVAVLQGEVEVKGSMGTLRLAGGYAVQVNPFGLLGHAVAYELPTENNLVAEHAQAGEIAAAGETPALTSDDPYAPVPEVPGVPTQPNLPVDLPSGGSDTEQPPTEPPSDGPPAEEPVEQPGEQPRTEKPSEEPPAEPPPTEPPADPTDEQPSPTPSPDPGHPVPPGVPPGLVDKGEDHPSSKGQARRAEVHTRNLLRWLERRLIGDVDETNSGPTMKESPNE